MKRIALTIVLVLVVAFAVGAAAIASGGSEAPADPAIADLQRAIPGGGGTWDNVQ